MATVDHVVRRGWGARVLLVLAFVLSPLVRGDSALPGSLGMGPVRGGDFPLPRPSWERRSLHALIREAAALYGVDPALVRAVVWVESRYDPYAVSPRGASGLMQLMPETARAVGVSNPLDPRQNVFGGVRYLSRLLKQHDGDITLALASYNAGPTAVRRFAGVPPYEQTQGYLRKIRRRFGGIPELAQPAAQVMD